MDRFFGEVETLAPFNQWNRNQLYQYVNLLPSVPSLVLTSSPFDGVPKLYFLEFRERVLEILAAVRTDYGIETQTTSGSPGSHHVLLHLMQ